MIGCIIVWCTGLVYKSIFNIWKDRVTGFRDQSVTIVKSKCHVINMTNNKDYIEHVQGRVIASKSYSL